MEDQKKKDEFYMQRALDEAQAAFAICMTRPLVMAPVFTAT